MGLFTNSPFMPRTPPKHSEGDLQWWKERLRYPHLFRPIPGPTPVIDFLAYSDASSEVGIGITIGSRWRAWRLLPGWKSNGRDIGWAEAVGFLFLCTTIRDMFPPPGSHIQTLGDNQGVVEGWRSGRSRNRPTNLIFRDIHDISEAEAITFHTQYVPSKENPADGPSRGLYGSDTLLLRPIVIPPNLSRFIADFDSAPLPAELRLIRKRNTRPPPAVLQKARGAPLP
jgi:hypothetical protein